MYATEAKARARLAALDTPKLAEMLRLAADPNTPEERMVRAWIIDTLEDRYPDASAAVEAAFDAAEERAIMAGENSDDAEVDYVAVLLADIPAVTA